MGRMTSDILWKIKAPWCWCLFTYNLTYKPGWFFGNFWSLLWPRNDWGMAGTLWFHEAITRNETNHGSKGWNMGIRPTKPWANSWSKLLCGPLNNCSNTGRDANFDPNPHWNPRKKTIIYLYLNVLLAHNQSFTQGAMARVNQQSLQPRLGSL